MVPFRNAAENYYGVGVLHIVEVDQEDLGGEEAMVMKKLEED